MRAIAYRVRCLVRRSLPSTVLAVALVAGTVAEVLAIAATATRTLSAADRYEASLGIAVDVLVEQQDTAAPRTEAIAALDSVAGVRSATFVFATLAPADGGEAVDSLVFAGSHEAFGTRLTAGRDPVHTGELAVSARFAARTGAGLGDRFRLFAVPPEQAAGSGFAGPTPTVPTLEAEVVGLFSGATELQDSFAIAVFPPTLLDDGDAIAMAGTQHAVELRPGAGVEQLRADLDGLAVAEPFGIEPADVVPGEVRDAVAARGLALVVVAAVVALAGIVVLGQLFARQFSLDEADRAILVAFGLTPRQLLAEPVLRAAIPAVAGAAAAGIGAIVASGHVPLGFVAALEPHPGVRIDPLVHGGGAFAAALLISGWVAAALGLQARAGAPRALSPAIDELVRRVPSGSAATGVRLALTPARGHRTAPAWALAGGAIVAAGAVAALIIGASVDRLLDDPARRGDTDLRIGLGGDTADRAALTTLIDSPLVVAVGRTGTALVSVGPDALDVLAIEMDRGAITPIVLSGRLPVGADELALGSVSARRLGVDVGDELLVTTNTGYGPVRRTLTVTAVAVIPSVDDVDGLGEGGYLTADGLRALAPGSAFPTIVANLVDDADGAAVAELQQRIGGGPGDPSAVIVNLSRVRAFPRAVAGALAVLSMMSLVHVLVRSIRRRRRDLATLVALGAGRRWIAGVVRWQASAMAVVVVAVGLPVGVVVGRIVASWYLARVGARPEPRVDPLMLLAAAGGVAALADLAARPAVAWLRRLRVGRELRGE